VSVEGPIIDVRLVDFKGDLLPMAVRYLDDHLGANYAKQWAEADTGADHVYTMRPQRWASADMTSLFG
jgi:hypothetical protein